MSKLPTENTIVLSAGPVNYVDLPLLSIRSMSMIPVNGKPIIAWILDDLIEKGIRSVTLVIRDHDETLETFLDAAFQHRIEIQFGRLIQSRSILDSLFAGIEINPTADQVRVILGDTMIKDSFHLDFDFAYANTVELSSRWCVIKTGNDGTISKYIDKPEEEIENANVLCGYYHFTDGAWLRECVLNARAAGEKELSHVLRRYATRKPIRAVAAQQWYDFGHIDTLVQSKQRLLQARFFNSFTINSLFHTITKKSLHNEKLKDELNWFLSLPENLKILSPRIVSSSSSPEGEITVTQEYYGYPALSEYFVYSDLSRDNWITILKLLFRIHTEFKKYSRPATRGQLVDMYWIKTEKRLSDLSANHPEWTKLLAHPTIVVNNKELAGWPRFKSSAKAKCEELDAKFTDLTIIHGDYCFSNILFDVSNQIIRLIDPRGSFGEKGIYGDPRYDIAKLRHSACEFYDYIVGDMFYLNHVEGSNQFELNVHVRANSRKVADDFDKLLKSNGYSPGDIKFIEALLFLSMLPLHNDKPLRQKAMFVTGIQLLNEILK